MENLEQILKMVGGSISDVSFCEDDLSKLNQDFSCRFPGYPNPKLDTKSKNILENINLDFVQFRKRTFVKTVFIYFEGILFAMKRIILNNYYEKLKNKERIKLQEFKLERKQISYKLFFLLIETLLFYIKNIFFNNSYGLNIYDIFKYKEQKLFLLNPEKFTVKPFFMSFIDNYKFTIRIYEKFRTTEYKTNFNCTEFGNLKESLKIRNRITHPKHSKDLNITDGEINKIRNSHSWFFDVYNALLKNEKY